MTHNLCVCSECFDDYALVDFINGNASSCTCDFCGQTGDVPIATKLEEVIRLIEESIHTEYDMPHNHLPWDGREGGWQIAEVYDTHELLFEVIGIELPKDQDQKLAYMISGGITNTEWCEDEPLRLRESERLRYSWSDFCDLIKYEKRYLFMEDNRHSVVRGEFGSDDLLDPNEILGEISRICEEHELFVVVNAGISFFRARHQKDGKTLSGPLDFGPPPREKAIVANRMNPPGIPMFYVSTNAETALKEIAEGSASYAIAEFGFKKDILILDLTRLPSIPSIFDSENRPFRNELNFLHGFLRDVSKPVARDKKNHIEYVPTQVVTEYFRHHYSYQGKQIDGICYPSVQNSTGKSLVIFATQDDLVLPVDLRPESDSWGQYSFDEKQKFAWIELLETSSVST
ncbi:MAG: HEPN-associated N-terminal domain-containing protein [bacterium]|nr:HEPN-associated N-terminal domain-containing protein [bacterium]